MTDLLHLWEAENYRISCGPCVVFELADVQQFTLANFRALRSHLVDKRYLLWDREDTRMLGVSVEGVQEVEHYTRTVLRVSDHRSMY